jgi:hypothetical protein
MAEKTTKRVSWDGKADENSGFPVGYKEDPNGQWTVVETSVKDGEKQVPLVYVVPHLAVFRQYLAGLPDKSEKGISLETIHERYVYAEDLKQRAAQRESVAAESTTLMVDGKPVDLMALEPKKAVAAVNAAHMWAATTGKDVQKAAIVARRKMLEGGVGGQEVVLDEASQMLKMTGKGFAKK